MSDAGDEVMGRLTYKGLKKLEKELAERGHHLVADVFKFDPADDGDGRQVWRATVRMHDTKLPNAHESIVDEPVFKDNGRVDEFAAQRAVAKAHRNVLRVLVPKAMQCGGCKLRHGDGK